MDKLIQQYPYQVLGVVTMAIAATLGALHKLGWLRIGRKKVNDWDGTERRECSQHPALSQKVCALYNKLDEVDKKLDTVAEKLQYVLGTLEAKWGKR